MDANIAYVGPADLHDGRILEVSGSGGPERTLRVVARGASGRRYTITFRDVSSVAAHRPEGMLLYAVADLEGDQAGRRVSFVNWDEDDDARLEVIAMAIDVAEVDEGT